MNYLKKKLYTDRKYVISVIITADCNKKCSDNILKNKRLTTICNDCKNKIEEKLKKY